MLYNHFYTEVFLCQAKAGVCCIPGCPQLGKFLKRLDNHLSSHHKGISRSMNDSKTVLPSGVRLREKCEIPGCGKQVLHLGRHIKNIHKMGMSSYRAKIKSDAEKRSKKIVNNICIPETPIQKAIEYSGNDSVNCIPESPTCSEIKKDEKGTDNAHVKALFKDDLPAVRSKTNRANVSSMQLPLDNEENDEYTVSANDDEFEFSFDRFCFIKHQVTPYGVLALCAFLKKKSLSQFFLSKLCRNIFGPLTLSQLNDVYKYRQYLNGYFRFVRYLKYRLDHDVIKSRIGSCLACGAGNCTCPIPSKTFYLEVKKFKCADETDRRICKRTRKSVDHDCFDFFHCKVCAKYYNNCQKLTGCTYAV